MLGTYLSLIFAIFLVISFYSLSSKLELFSNKSASGRLSFFAGALFLTIGALWVSVRLLPDYADWFIASAYSFIDIVHLIIVASGLSLTVKGLVSFYDAYNDLQAEVEFRFQKLGILENLQRDAREPYQFLELLNLAVKEIAGTIPECSGVVFLTGRNRKQFVLATSIGLTAEETGYLEYFPFGENIVSQSVESGEPILSGGFSFDNDEGQLQESRFHSALILPLVSGMDRIGAIVLLSTVERIFSHHDVRVLAPVGEWLAEKIKSARATRELSAVRKEKEDQSEFFNDSSGRIQAATKAVGTTDPLSNLASIMSGFVESESVHIVQSTNGGIEFLAGTEPLLELDEQFAEAITGTISRGKISVVNQNAEDEQGRTFTRASTLVYPLSDLKSGHAILLRRQSIPFSLKNSELKVMSILAEVISSALTKIDTGRSEVTHRLGFDKIVQLLRLPPRLSFNDDTGFLARHLASVLPTETSVLTFETKENVLHLADYFGEASSGDLQMEIDSGEGFVGRMLESKSVVSITGSRDFEKQLNEYGDSAKAVFKNLVVNSFTPAHTIATPIMMENKVAGVIVFMFKFMTGGERREWERLITLACGLFSLRMTVASPPRHDSKPAVGDDVAKITNAINNNLSAVIGNAEILMTKDGLKNDVRSHIQSIMNEAEVAASEVKKLLNDSDNIKSRQEQKPKLTSLNEIARMSLQRSHVSENLYMVAGRAREIELKLEKIEGYTFPAKQTQELFSGAINKFASMADEEDIITISTYIKDESLYLDISRHRRNFPPVESVAGFGNYQVPEAALKSRPADKYLENLTTTNGSFAYDRFSTAPSYLSFKFPLSKTTGPGSNDESIQVLAVDDQPVILELISAMCQTLGYTVTTAGSGAEALEISRNRSFNVILTDLAMPGMSGLELAKKMRSVHPDTPMILITGWEATIGEQELRESGITDILYKPFRIEQLTNLVKIAATGQSV